ncbi:MAG: hypothetical protein WDN76_06085 [Alphaproteobacteria bacterium]
MNTLGYALIQRDQGLDEGFKLLKQAVEIDPDYYPVVDSLGWAYYQYGDFGPALKYVLQANALSQASNPEILDHLGDIYWRSNRQGDARESWKKALTTRPGGHSPRPARGKARPRPGQARAAEARGTQHRQSRQARCTKQDLSVAGRPGAGV